MTEQIIDVGTLLKDANENLTAEEKAELKLKLSEKLQQLDAATE